MHIISSVFVTKLSVNKSPDESDVCTLLSLTWNKVYNYAGIYNMRQKIDQIIFLKQLGLTGYYVINLFYNCRPRRGKDL
jgi:hypothetical protein